MQQCGEIEKTLKKSKKISKNVLTIGKVCCIIGKLSSWGEENEPKNEAELIFENWTTMKFLKSTKSAKESRK